MDLTPTIIRWLQAGKLFLAWAQYYFALTGSIFFRITQIFFRRNLRAHRKDIRGWLIAQKTTSAGRTYHSKQHKRLTDTQNKEWDPKRNGWNSRKKSSAYRCSNPPPTTNNEENEPTYNTTPTSSILQITSSSSSSFDSTLGRKERKEGNKCSKGLYSRDGTQDIYQ